MIKVLDPRLSAEGDALVMAPAPATLKGAVIGLVDNAKIGTERLYDHLARLLEERYGVRETIRRRKPDASRPVPEDMLASLTGADAIIAGIGD